MGKKNKIDTMGIKTQEIEMQTPEGIEELQGPEQKYQGLPNAPYHPPLCAICRGKTRVYHTAYPVRYIRCLKCGYTDKTRDTRRDNITV